jgi:hypothetical protein
MRNAPRGAITTSSAWLCGLLLGVSSSVSAQTPPPIGGVTGTLALEGTVKNLLVHGSKDTTLEGLHEGSQVVVHYAMDGPQEAALEVDSLGDQGLKTSEGVVTRIDRRRKQIAIKYPDGKVETLRLTDRAALDAGNEIGPVADGTTRVIVYYSGEGGQKVAHFFKTIPKS